MPKTATATTTVILSPSLKQGIKELCEHKNWSMTAAINAAVYDYLLTYKREQLEAKKIEQQLLDK